MKQRLEKSVIVQCHIDKGNPESFVVGQIVYVDSKWMLMKDISTSGRWNGLALYKRSDLVSVKKKSDYLTRMQILVNHRNRTEPPVPIMFGNPLITLLQYAKETSAVVGLELLSSGHCDIYGFVSSVDHHYISVHQIDEYGHDDGTSLISTSVITRCFLGDEEAECLEILFRKQCRSEDGFAGQEDGSKPMKKSPKCSENPETMV